MKYCILTAFISFIVFLTGCSGKFARRLITVKRNKQQHPTLCKLLQRKFYFMYFCQICHLSGVISHSQ